ncbi:MAG: helix-turn-helix domain-containing protein [Oceanospirillaceae bacterium]|nr:helix-turn-helix domain-containing protein [Oceanospirillaceae bacterium]
MKNIETLPSADNPEEALAAVVALRHLAEQLERQAVKEAIKQGWSWSEIAGALGVSKQAAHKRHAADIHSSKKDR